MSKDTHDWFVSASLPRHGMDVTTNGRPKHQEAFHLLTEHKSQVLLTKILANTADFVVMATRCSSIHRPHARASQWVEWSAEKDF